MAQKASAKKEVDNHPLPQKDAPRGLFPSIFQKEVLIPKTVVNKAYMTTELFARVTVPDDFDDEQVLEFAQGVDGASYVENPDNTTSDWENASIVYDDTPNYEKIFGEPIVVD